MEPITTTASPTPITKLIQSSSKTALSEGSFYQITLLELDDGIQLMSWSSQFNTEQKMSLKDDSDNIYFSFNLTLKGIAQCCFQRELEDSEHNISQGCGSISYHPTHQGQYTQEGALKNITLIMHKGALSRNLNNHEDLMEALAQHNGYINHLYLPELYATARQIYDEMNHLSSTRNTLWFKGQGLIFISLFIEALFSVSSYHNVSASDQLRLFSVKNHLLDNINQPPTIAQLAKKYGFSASTLTRSFRRVFGCSIHEMLQRERMAYAHEKLLRSKTSVTEVATDLGYSNLSHFSSIFRKHFGFLPGQVRHKQNQVK